MNNNVFDDLFEGFSEFDEEVILDNVFDGLFDGFNELDADPLAVCTDPTNN